jgi:Arm DNA-binding domain
MKLTETSILKLECPAGRKDMLVKDDGQPGLFLRVSANGGRSYLAQYTVDGIKRRVPLGALTLALARSAAAAVLGEVAQGRDPAGDRKAKALEAKTKAAHVALTLGVLVDQWAALSLADARPSYAAEAPRAIRKAFAKNWRCLQPISLAPTSFAFSTPSPGIIPQWRDRWLHIAAPATDGR